MTRATAPRTIAGMKIQAATPADRVRASEARKIRDGGKRMPGGIMPADAVEALDLLRSEGYGDSASACIYRAIIEAAEKYRTKG